MKINVNPKLQNYIWEIKRNEKFSIKEIIIMKSIISSEKKWMIYVDYFMDFLFILGISIFMRRISNIFDIQNSIFFELLISGVIYGTHKIFWSIFHSYSIYKELKSDGVTCSEIEFLSNVISNVYSTHSALNFLKITHFLYASKTQKEIFEPIVADWQEEYFEALFKKEIWKARWINVRYTYAFIAAMWQKSPVGDLIEFVAKIAKQ